MSKLWKCKVMFWGGGGLQVYKDSVEQGLIGTKLSKPNTSATALEDACVSYVCVAIYQKF